MQEHANKQLYIPELSECGVTLALAELPLTPLLTQSQTALADRRRLVARARVTSPGSKVKCDLVLWLLYL